MNKESDQRPFADADDFNNPNDDARSKPRIIGQHFEIRHRLLCLTSCKDTFDYLPMKYLITVRKTCKRLVNLKHIHFGDSIWNKILGTLLIIS